MKIDKQSERLAKLVAIQMGLFVIVEIAAAALIAMNIIPPFLGIGVVEGYIVQINTGFIIIVSLVILLVAALELAVMTEIARVIRWKEI